MDDYPDLSDYERWGLTPLRVRARVRVYESLLREAIEMLDHDHVAGQPYDPELACCDLESRIIAALQEPLKP